MFYKYVFIVFISILAWNLQAFDTYWADTNYGADSRQYYDPYAKAKADARYYYDYQVSTYIDAIKAAGEVERAKIEDMANTAYTNNFLKQYYTNKLKTDDTLQKIHGGYDLKQAKQWGEFKLEMNDRVHNAQLDYAKKCWNGACGREYMKQMKDDARTQTLINAYRNYGYLNAAEQQMARDIYNENMKTKKFQTDSYYDWIRYIREQGNSIHGY